MSEVETFHDSQGDREGESDGEEVVFREDTPRVEISTPPTRGRRSPAVACWASDHWVVSSNPLRGKFHH